MEVLKQAGYTVKDVCSVLGISRSGYYAQRLPKEEVKGTLLDIKDAELLGRIKAIKLEHPFWGYRRLWAYLNHRGRLLVNQKRVRRIMRGHNLLVTRTVHKAKRDTQRSKPRADRPRQYWGTDMTKFIIPAMGWVYLVIVLDWFTKKIVG